MKTGTLSRSEVYAGKVQTPLYYIKQIEKLMKKLLLQEDCFYTGELFSLDPSQCEYCDSYWLNISSLHFYHLHYGCLYRHSVLFYFRYGSPNEAGENLATCIWQSRKHALVANRNPKHAIAAKLASVSLSCTMGRLCPVNILMYPSWDLSIHFTYRLPTKLITWNDTYLAKSGEQPQSALYLGKEVMLVFEVISD